MIRKTGRIRKARQNGWNRGRLQNSKKSGEFDRTLEGCGGGKRGEETIKGCRRGTTVTLGWGPTWEGGKILTGAMIKGKRQTVPTRSKPCRWGVRRAKKGPGRTRAGRKPADLA